MATKAIAAVITMVVIASSLLNSDYGYSLTGQVLAVCQTVAFRFVNYSRLQRIGEPVRKQEIQARPLPMVRNAVYPLPIDPTDGT